MLKTKVIQTIQKNHLIETGDKVIIGVSGGPDSICLLHILNEIKEILGITLYVAHVNHKIRKNANLDEQYVQEFCKKINIPFFAKQIDVQKIAKQNKIGLEEAGRKARYDFFEEVFEKTKANKIATAHTANDNAETVIMHFIRGTGLNGLKGIEKTRQNKYIRPLIECTREEVEEYCEKNNLNPRIDETNEENIYTRNKIRNICIPYIKNEFNQNIVKTINRLAEIVTEEDEYLQNQTEKIYHELCEKENKTLVVLNLKKFNQEHLVIKRRILLYTINKVLGNTNGIEKKNIEDVLRLCKRNIGNKYLYPNKNIKIAIQNKKIFFTRENNLP